jgi:hypothetical protein
MHRRASFLCAVFRYARQTFTTWPGDWLNARSLARVNAFLPAFLARRCSWVFCAPRRFIPADGCRAVSGVPGPRVVLLAARPPRLVFVGVTSRLVESTLEKAVGRGLCSVRDDRLLGFTPVCDPHPTAPRCQSTVAPQDRSCLGLCLLQGWRALDCASKPGSTPNSIISLREHADRFHANSASLSAHGFQAASADCEPARLPSLQRIDGADAWLTWTASRAARANSLSEVLHRP